MECYQVESTTKDQETPSPAHELVGALTKALADNTASIATSKAEFEKKELETRKAKYYKAQRECVELRIAKTEQVQRARLAEMATWDEKTLRQWHKRANYIHPYEEQFAKSRGIVGSLDAKDHGDPMVINASIAAHKQELARLEAIRGITSGQPQTPSMSESGDEEDNALSVSEIVPAEPAKRPVGRPKGSVKQK